MCIDCDDGWPPCAALVVVVMELDEEQAELEEQAAAPPTRTPSPAAPLFMGESATAAAKGQLTGSSKSSSAVSTPREPRRPHGGCMLRERLRLQLAHHRRPAHARVGILELRVQGLWKRVRWGLGHRSERMAPP